MLTKKKQVVLVTSILLQVLHTRLKITFFIFVLAGIVICLRGISVKLIFKLFCALKQKTSKSFINIICSQNSEALKKYFIVSVSIVSLIYQSDIQKCLSVILSNAILGRYFSSNRKSSLLLLIRCVHPHTKVRAKG